MLNPTNIMRQFEELGAIITQLRSENASLKEQIKGYQKQQPVAWVEVIDRDYGPYNFHGVQLLDNGKHELFVKLKEVESNE